MNAFDSSDPGGQEQIPSANLPPNNPTEVLAAVRSYLPSLIVPAAQILARELLLKLMRAARQNSPGWEAKAFATGDADLRAQLIACRIRYIAAMN